jgi:DNA primase
MRSIDTLRAPRPGAAVSMPVAWSELTAKLSPASFTVLTAPARLARQRKDPWADYFVVKQRLTQRAIAALAAVTRRDSRLD